MAGNEGEIEIDSECVRPCGGGDVVRSIPNLKSAARRLFSAEQAVHFSFGN